MPAIDLFVLLWGFMMEQSKGEKFADNVFNYVVIPGIAILIVFMVIILGMVFAEVFFK